MQCSAVYFIFNSLVYVHINYKIDKKTSVNPYLYFNLYRANIAGGINGEDLHMLHLNVSCSWANKPKGTL